MPDDNTSEAAAQTLSRRRRRRRVAWLVGLTFVFIVVAVLYGIYWATIARYQVTTDDAYVHGNQVSIMSQVSGTVTAVHVDNTDVVHQGETLLAIDPSDSRIALQRAEAKLAQTVRHVRSLLQQQARQKAAIAAAEATLSQAHDDYARARRLYASNALSKRDFQHARTKWRNARAALHEAQSALAALQTQTAGTDLRHQPDVRLAIAAVRQAYLNLQRTTIVAPVDGYVAQRSVQVGQQVSPGTPLLAVVSLDHVWVQANFKETQLGDLRIGQPVTLTSDFYGDDVTYHGHVAGISPGTGSVFELLPPQNATGNWIKVVQRVPVRIRLDADEIHEHPLRLGLSMHATVDIHDTNGKVLKHHPGNQPLYQTDVYEHQLDSLNKLIKKIIQTNSKPVSGTRAHHGD